MKVNPKHPTLAPSKVIRIAIKSLKALQKQGIKPRMTRWFDVDDNSGEVCSVCLGCAFYATVNPKLSSWTSSLDFNAIRKLAGDDVAEVILFLNAAREALGLAWTKPSSRKYMWNDRLAAWVNANEQDQNAYGRWRTKAEKEFGPYNQFPIATADVTRFYRTLLSFAKFLESRGV